MSCDKKHDLLRIFGTYSDYQGDKVVRWCRQCGAIVVDLEVDGRVHPGRIRKMQRPNNAIAKKGSTVY